MFNSHSYAPCEAWRRRLAGERAGDPWKDLLQVYGQWMARFPGRAEPYVWAAIVYEQRLGDASRARSTLAAGLKQGAQPAGLLETYLAKLSAGG